MGADWGPVIVAVVLFILLSPGLLFQLPARTRVMEFGNMMASGIAILVHAVIYFCILTILIIAIGLLFELPARTRVMEFGNMMTSGIAILVHAVIYFCILTILIIAIGIHIHVN